ncbi:hypothetical protein Patl1_22321 [Pistacia atlantica]|uniref:Uncharacterized protein n=1 Tax=Pistacia atlantica TaxID=434234 RepID=A0ACC1A102_9ROSI|nr:hypothetical protein Patl1_22321 [Pistacia atlantica]
MATQLTPEEIHEILNDLKRAMNMEVQTSEQAAEQENLMVTTLNRLRNRSLAIPHREAFEAGMALGMLSQHIDFDV